MTAWGEKRMNLGNARAADCSRRLSRSEEVYTVIEVSFLKASTPSGVDVATAAQSTLLPLENCYFHPSWFSFLLIVTTISFLKEFSSSDDKSTSHEFPVKEKKHFSVTFCRATKQR
ncbi:hypothetical protein HZH68_015268 [Vespula germanica]|uniref:Uncharacterized protein n=1 Tax=Vespula germanica TaxID=30212 RepID=A0A834J8G2_VESGE|nr:hypothetical protein HZH68_015268 [Vespula germanica]